MGSDCIVRIAGPRDLRAVLHVHAAHDPAAYAPDSPSRLVVDTWATMMQTPGLAVYLAEVDDVPVGTATMIAMPNITYGCAPTAFVEAVVVARPYRRRGIATAVMRRLLDDARLGGCNKIQLLSHKRHATDGAHQLYVRLGFQPEAEGFRLYLQERPRT